MASRSHPGQGSRDGDDLADRAGQAGQVHQPAAAGRAGEDPPRHPRGLGPPWRSDITLWDDTGLWKGMPERVEEAVYGGLSKDDQDKIEAATPTKFGGPEQAIAWGMDQGCFEALQHARNAYDELKRLHAPKSAQEMWDLWIAEVQARKAAQAAAQAGEVEF